MRSRPDVHDQEHAMTSLDRALGALRPNRPVSRPVALGLTVVSVAALIAIWQLCAGVVPAPGAVVAALGRLWGEQGLFDELSTSFLLNVEAIAWAAAISLALAYI